ncbi:uncharacterized protein PHACADRAFT_137157 [Phanerochaete carnosa HHB-10118-sp]|uniref:Response regulatory domain-containing protein n=1 Tax=Phanerochaete carnosa (strain HHB-10118-sp) TaxID=650164 RepID=K5X973_PHACS|nr:uncharacterized protein PHACADRAFT_137157 [Phanerochaete carnosa HHB-10118-sp]EKM59422.1 hypothetical protein PHACADRAFT_137157 [Phanerochaete carnosa HHB-10118-sp]
MTGARLPVVRIPPVAPGQGGGEEMLEQDHVLVELPSSSKFGIAWPAEQRPQVPLPLGAERPVALSSSDGETDVSEEETSPLPKRNPRPEDFGGDFDFVTPTNHLESEQNPMDQAGRLTVPRRLSRAFSMPLPSQLSSLRNPKRTPSSNGSPSPVANDQAPELDHFRELSLELADSVQMVIQTLLQLSPPQVLDPVKEQFSACSLSIPTPSISAMFTTMKNLNYMSANMAQLGSDPQPNEVPPSKTSALSMVQDDFDVGELLQSVGDALSGVGAQAGVDLVLFHSDVAMKHVAVKGDENGISYTLAHVIRQVIDTAQKGDTIEVGLHIDYVDTAVAQSNAEGSPISRVASPTADFDGLLRCNFRIAHRLSTSDILKSSEAESQELQSSHSSRPSPLLNTLFLRRLLRHVGATLTVDSQPVAPSANRMCEVTVHLEPGEPTAVNPSVTVTLEDAAVLGYPDMHIANEPTLEQLTSFAETLRGKSVTLYASSSGSFAHHLSSYLTAWGMDVSHMSTERGVDGEYEIVADVADTAAPAVSVIDLPPSADTPTGAPSGTGRKSGSDSVFVLIDDDVAVLRNRLQKIKVEQAYPLSMNSRSKRPSLATNHRPRSSPQVARVMGMLGNSPPQPQVVIVHFTSLANFKLVKDVIQTTLMPTKESGASRIPEVIVIPKPAGPRRFLTALHTAVTRPVVDPYFVPTATSPMSPGLHSISPFFFSSAPKSPSGRSTASARTTSDRSNRSPKELGGEWTLGHAPPSPLSQPDNVEYFSDAVVKLGHSSASGLLIQSPDGQPTGIFFQPKSRNTASPPSPTMEREKEQQGRQIHPPTRHRAYSRVPSGGNKTDGGGEGLPSGSDPTVRPSSRPPPASLEIPDTYTTTTGKGKVRQASETVSEDSAASSGDQAAVPPAPETSTPQGSRQYLTRRQSHQLTSPPTSPQTRAAPGPSSRRLTRRPTPDSHVSSPTGAAKKAVKGPADGNIVPPISVLIVDDNPINQTILTTFMKKKKIKHDVAKNGEEAVQKWRSGIFHLILMDIQMPVMDGIQATKEIRRLEKQNGQPFPSTPQSEGQQTPSETSTTDSRNMSTPPYRSSVIIVALTASSLQADRVAALAAGCNDFLTKPVSLQWLNSKIIEWGSIKALQMWADIRPEVVRSLTTGQTAQAAQVARRLHVPEGRSSTPSTGERSRGTSMAARRAHAENLQAAGAEKAATPNTPLSDDSPGLSSFDANRSSTAANPMMPPIPSMTASEAALSLASAYRPQASVDAARSASDGKVSSNLPAPSSEAAGASEPPSAKAEAPLLVDPSTIPEPQTEPSPQPEADVEDDTAVPEESAAPPPQPEAEPQ